MVELMIVIAIIAILAAILIPNFLRAKAQSTASACESNLKAIAVALEEYRVDHPGVLPASGVVTSTAIGTDYLGFTPTDPVNGSNYSMNTSAGTYGVYLVTDSGGHDPTTVKGLQGAPGTGSIQYYESSGLHAK